MGALQAQVAVQGQSNRCVRRAGGWSCSSPRVAGLPPCIERIADVELLALNG